MKKRRNQTRFFLFWGCLFLVLILIIVNLFNFYFKADQINPSGVTIKNPVLTASDIDSDNTQLNWTLESNDQSIRVERSLLPFSDFSKIVDLPANSTSYTDTDTLGKRYYYKIIALNGDQTASSNIATPTRTEPKDLLLGIGNFYGSSTDQNGINVPWGWSFNCTQKGTDGYLSKDHCLAETENNETDNSQKIGIKNINNPSGDWAYISKQFLISDELNFGDTVKFKIDKVAIQDFDVPAGSGLEAFMRIRSYYEGSDNNFKTQEKYNLSPETINSEAKITYELPKIPADASQDEINLLKKTYNLVFEFCVFSQNTYDKEPAIEISGAHIFVKKANDAEFQTIQIPIEINRNIKTQKIFFDSQRDSVLLTAKNFDAVMGDITNFSNMAQTKFYNPNIQLYCYFQVGANDSRNSSYADPKIDSSIGFAWILDNHPEWLYEYPPNTAPLEPPGDHRAYDAYNPDSGTVNQFRLYKNDGVTPLDYVFSSEYQTLYPIKVALESYQQAWVNNILSLHQQNPFDGVFIDGFSTDTIYGTKTETDGSKSTITVAETTISDAQNFAHSVIPVLKSAGIETMVNQSSRHYQSWPGKALFNPTWNPDSEIPGQNGIPNDFNPADYLKNDSDNTVDIFFQEHAYIGLNWQKDDLRNVYDLNEWEKGIEDLEFQNELNQNSLQKKKVFQLVLSLDRPDIGDPAVNPITPENLGDLSKYDTGWAKFALGSYLLSSNEYTYLGIANKSMTGLDWNSYSDPLDPNIELTSRLGNPLESRIIYESSYPDKSLQSRKFANGLVIVNGSPDQPRQYNLSTEMMDDLGRIYQPGQYELMPHTSRIFFTFLNQPTVNNSSKKITFKPNITLEGTKESADTKILINDSDNEVTLLNNSWSKEINLNSGSQSVTIRAVDNFGNTSKSISWEIIRYKPADANNDGKVNISDFSILLANWGKTITNNNQNADFTEDNKIDIKDFSNLMANWGK